MKSTIKTAEEFVVNELIETRKEMAELKSINEELETLYESTKKEYMNLYYLIESIVSFKKSCNGVSDIAEFRTIWNDFDKDTYEKLAGYFPQLVTDGDKKLAYIKLKLMSLKL